MLTLFYWCQDRKAARTIQKKLKQKTSLNTLMKAGLDLDTNILTDILMFIFRYNAEIWWSLLGVVVFKKLVWRYG